jgi:aspartyl-tRNA(Asn)/glutamyl-tRNA(Gln) amidotransferase subunit A
VSDPIFFEDIARVAARLARRELSSQELTTALLDRIERLEPLLNAYITVDAEGALAQARASDERRASEADSGPLDGIPIAVKDNVATAGLRTTAGSRLYQRWVPERDASVVAALRGAGAVVIGKTNLHELAIGATTENPHFGPTRNPWDPTRIPGGSSGGSAAALASGMAYGALGTDTGGSIRMPAALCGIVGLKPTYGRVSRAGIIGVGWSLDHCGPMGRTVQDVALMLEVMAGHDSADPTTTRDPLESYAAALARSEGRLPSGLRIGIVRRHFFEDLNPAYAERVEDAIGILGSLGARFVELSIPHLEEGLVAQRGIAQAEAYATYEVAFRRDPEAFGKDLAIRLRAAKAITAAHYLNAQRIRAMVRAAFAESMRSCDVLVAPMNAQPAFTIGATPPEHTIMNTFKLGRATLSNLTGLPAISVPCGLADGLPVGLQLIGRPFEESLLLATAHAYECAFPFTKALAANERYLISA